MSGKEGADTQDTAERHQTPAAESSREAPESSREAPESSRQGGQGRRRRENRWINKINISTHWKSCS